MGVTDSFPTLAANESQLVHTIQDQRGNNIQLLVESVEEFYTKTKISQP